MEEQVMDYATDHKHRERGVGCAVYLVLALLVYLAIWFDGRITRLEKQVPTVIAQPEKEQ
jgi:hypothetical protein